MSLKNETKNDEPRDTSFRKARLAALPANKKPGILIVDDDRLVRHGFRVWMASTGAEAVHLYSQNMSAISVVLLDVCMLGGDGPITLESLRTLNPGVTACFMSGDFGSFTLDDLLRLRVQHVFTKPFILAEMAKELRSLARLHQTMRSGFRSSAPLLN